MERRSKYLIPKRDVERFLRTVPGRARPFPDHPDPRVRRISLRDLYRAALRGINDFVATLESSRAADQRDLLGFTAGLQNSLNPFLARNPRVVRLLADLVPALLDEIDGLESGEEEDVYLFSTLQLALPLLSPPLRERSRALLRRVRRRIGRVDVEVFVSDESPVVPLLRARRRPDRAHMGSAWERWLYQVVEARFAHCLGLALDVDAFYERTAAEILEIPFDDGYTLELFNVHTHAIFGMGFYNTIPLAKHPVALRLADHGLRFLDWLDEHPLGDDVEILAECVDAFMKATSRGYGSDPRYGSIVAAILDSQRRDGGWAPPPRGEDPEALYRAYHQTWVCVDALRPLRLDLLNPHNRALGLV